MRGFGYHELMQFDPFLMFDDFSNTEATAYQAGFPMHPHRGIETVTYILKGEVIHHDSLGNIGSIKAGEIQWMSAGSGIVHEEMPVVYEGGIQGFQLWVNLPQEHKMMSPRYQEIKSDGIPRILEAGIEVRIIAGKYNEMVGPVQDLIVSATYLDVSLDVQTKFSFPTDERDTYFVYVFEGRLALRDDRSESWIGTGDIALLTKDRVFTCVSGTYGARFLLIGGKPIGEPIAWNGPIVMNTEAELHTASVDLQNGTFIK